MVRELKTPSAVAAVLVGGRGWPEQRRREPDCEEPDQQPVVIIAGGGQSGLELAARLKYLGVKTLAVECEVHIGNLW